MVETLRDWLHGVLDHAELSDEVRGYLLSRGATSEQIQSWGCFSWEEPDTDCPDERFAKSFGDRGQVLNERLIIPLYSPRGQFLGWDYRSIHEKRAGRFRVGDRPWDPGLLGIQEALPKIWSGADVYIVEGAFDVFALARVFPEAAVIGTGPATVRFNHLEFLRRFAKGHIYMVYDNDKAGRQGAEKAVENMEKRDLPVSILRYGVDGDDPGRIWDQGGMSALSRVFR